ncbi:unnamed protein product [Symbiodinium pilosum]|uniref:Uncharacterized protein n=1 Tax=Symbiodinium pilosum TaxID=2952 RepID=A0A812VXR8_SYMPI|nr:unnamed protein product [Symbiodinium pilosum]
MSDWRARRHTLDMVAEPNHAEDKKNRKESPVDMGFEAALAAAAKERAEAEASGSCGKGEEVTKKLKPKVGSSSTKSQQESTAQAGGASKPNSLLASGKGEVVDAFSYDPTKKPDADYSKPDPLSIANSGLDIQRRIYEQDRSEYSADQLRRCDAIARGKRWGRQKVVELGLYKGNIRVILG